MMNYIWGFMLIAGIVVSLASGRADAFTDSFLASCTDAVEFTLSLAGVMAVWSGLMKIAEESGLIDHAAKALRPILTFLFPKEKNSQTLAMMIMSFMANIFGAGNSATVFSLKAMEKLDAENGHSPRASNAMCMFLALSMSMIQLIPITVIKVRSDLGSASPDDIILPSIAAGLISMAVSVWICKLFERKSPDA